MGRGDHGTPLVMVLVLGWLAGCAGGAGGTASRGGDGSPLGSFSGHTVLASSSLRPGYVLWVEQGTIDKTDADFFSTQYTNLLSWLESNAEIFPVRRIIVRVEDPASDTGSAPNPWSPTPGCAFATGLAAQMPADIELYVLLDAPDPAGSPACATGATEWSYASSISDAVGRQLFWVQQMNAVINKTGPDASLIQGVVYDPDAFSEDCKEQLLSEIQSQLPLYPPAPRIGMTFDVSELKKSLVLMSGSPGLDEAYLEVYNISTDSDCGDVPGHPPCTGDIYSQNLNDPKGIFQAFTGLLQAEPNNWQKIVLNADQASRVYALFSVEHLGGGCITPNQSNGECGQIDAFGLWSSGCFVDFLELFASPSSQATLLAPGSNPIPAGNLGAFQYNFMPPTMATCPSTLRDGADAWHRE